MPEGGGDADTNTGTTTRCGDHAAVVAHDLPERIDCRARYYALVTMRNTGDVTWTRAEGYKLGTVDDKDTFFDVTRVRLGVGSRMLRGETGLTGTILITP